MHELHIVTVKNFNTFLRPLSYCASPVLAIIAASFCWGSASAMTKSIVADTDPLAVLFIQLLASSLFLWTIVILKSCKLPTNKEALKIGSMGLLEPGLAYLLSTIGLLYTTASASSLIFATEPAMVACIAWFILRERIAKRTAKLLLIAIFGVALTSCGAEPSQHSLIGDLFIIGSTLCASFYVVLNQRVLVSINPLVVAALQQSVALGFASTLLLTYLLCIDSDLIFATHNIGFIALSGIVQYGLAFWFYLIAVRSLPVTIATLFLCLIPVFTIAAGYLFLREQLTTMQWIGAILIVTAMLRLRGSEETEKLIINPDRCSYDTLG